MNERRINSDRIMLSIARTLLRTALFWGALVLPMVTMNAKSALAEHLMTDQQLAEHFFTNKIWLSSLETCAAPISRSNPDAGIAIYRVIPHPLYDEKKVILYSLHYEKDCGFILGSPPLPPGISWHWGDIETFGVTIKPDQSCQSGWKLEELRTIAHAGKSTHGPIQAREVNNRTINTCKPLDSSETWYELIASASKHALYPSVEACRARGLPGEPACDKGFVATFKLMNSGSNENRITDDISDDFPAGRKEYIWKDPGDGRFCGGHQASTKDCITAAGSGHLAKYRRTPGLDTLWGKKNSNNDIFENKNWVADLNGDGNDDYFYVRRNRQQYWALISKADGSGFEGDTEWGKRRSGHDIFGDNNWVADLNGDGNDDYFYARRNRQQYWALISKADGSGFEGDTEWGKRRSGHDIFQDKNWVADLNGDGNDDYFYVRRNRQQYWALISKADGSGFEGDTEWGKRRSGHDIFQDKNWVADLNGDGNDDYFYLRRGTHEYWALISKADGSGFEGDTKWGEKDSGNDISGDMNWVADLNGDGNDDYFYLRRNHKEYRALISKADGSGFEEDTLWGERHGNNDVFEDKNWVVDLNKDGNDDYVYVRRETFDYWALISKSDGSGFEPDRYLSSRFPGNDIHGDHHWVSDVNGDGIGDLLYLRRNTPEYRVLLMSKELANTCVFNPSSPACSTGP